MPQTQTHNRKWQTRHHHRTDNSDTSNTKRQDIRHRFDIAVRERAYFLWGSSPCLEWRVYTHNASPARRGGSPGQSAPPLGSPGSTGLGQLWCRTGKHRSPYYLQKELRDGHWDGNISCYASDNPVCYVNFIVLFDLVSEIKVWWKHTERKHNICSWILAWPLLWAIKAPKTTLPQLNVCMFYDFNIMFPTLVSKVMLCYTPGAHNLFSFWRTESYSFTGRLHWDGTPPLYRPLGTSAHLSAFHYSSVPADE